MLHSVGFNDVSSAYSILGGRYEDYSLESRKPQTMPMAVWDRVNNLGETLRFDAGQLLWEAGERSTGCGYIVVKGLLRLYHANSSGRVVTLLAIGPGGLLGQHYIPHLQTYSNGAEAVTNCQVLALPSTFLKDVRADVTDDEAAAWFREATLQQLAQTHMRLQLEYDCAKAKIAHVLLALDGERLLDHLSRQQLADIANLTIETTVRSISDFVRHGVLQSSHFTTLTAGERAALTGLLESEPSTLPYC